MKNRILAPLLIVASLASANAQMLYRPAGEIVPEKAYEFDLRASQFESTARIDDDGEEVAYEEGEGFTKTDVDIYLKYGFSRSLEFSLGGRYRMVTSTTETQENSNSGFESYWGAVKYPFSPTGNMRYAVSVKALQASYTNTDYETAAAASSSEDQVLGDSGTEFQFALEGSWLRKKDHALDGFIAFVIPGNNMSAEVRYDISTLWHFTRFAFGGGINGITSLSQDNREERTFQATGETNMFNSANRAFTRGYGMAYYAFDSFRIGGFVGSTFQATSYDKGMDMGLTLTFASKGRDKRIDKVEAFKEYDIEATVLKVSPRGKFVKIDHGIAQDVEKGMKFDIYQTDYFGGNTLLATGVVVEIGANWSIIKLAKIFKNVPIMKGFVARATN